MTELAPPGRTAERFLDDRRTLIALALIIALLCAITNLPWQLDDYDQAQQAFTSYEMLKEGHWLFQRTPHELIAQKPPLIGWISAALFTISHSWNLAWRLPSFAAAAAMSIILLRAATAAYGRIPGLLALSAFGLNLMTVRLATLVRTDMPLAFVTFLLGLMIFEKVRKREPWNTRDRWLFFLLLAASMWIKGPFAFVFVLPAVLLFDWRWRGEPGVRAWCGWWPWLGAAAAFSVWVVIGIRIFPTFYEQVVGFEFIDRFSSTVHRARPIYFYLPHLLHKLAPWSVLIIALAVVSVRRGEATFRETIQRIKPETAWLVAWSFTGFVIMSLVPSKRVDRVFSMVPPLCLLLSAQVSYGLSDTRWRARTLRWSAIALVVAMIFTGGYSAWKIGSGYADHDDALVRFSEAVREQARARAWRYEVISGTAGSEGMLLYLEKLHFIEPEDAVARWNAAALDALVLPAEDVAQVLPMLHGAKLSGLRSVHRKSQPRVDYVLVSRSPALR